MAGCRSETYRGEVGRIGSGRRGHVDGGARVAELNRPFGVCALRDGLLAFTDAHNNAVRFVVPEMTSSHAAVRRRRHVKTVENSGLLAPKGITASADERHLFVCDTGHHKIKFAALPSRSVLAGVDEVTDGVEIFAFAGSGKKGWRDGPALEASFNSPSGVCEHADGTIIVADTGNHCIRQIRREDGNTAAQLIVCDGGDNVIKMLPLEELMQQFLNVEERFDPLNFIQTTTIRSTFPHSGSESRSCEESVGSLSPRTNYTDPEDLGEENQLENDCKTCPCEASQALEEALGAISALQTENLRLRELLQCTFDEIELADKRFSENYQPQIDEASTPNAAKST
ncbi:NHL repeat-containing protein [Phytophthora cinnamomi]|uniref:NHL repeat-containing protein n=1 Tax=Phytophthora cinnamomi TaxID=4785 RepID=UPI00355A3FE3|nr:NHL repeat-containing protein [Phytophthora cinnamomi]